MYQPVPTQAALRTGQVTDLMYNPVPTRAALRAGQVTDLMYHPVPTQATLRTGPTQAADYLKPYLKPGENGSPIKPE